MNEFKEKEISKLFTSMTIKPLNIEGMLRRAQDESNHGLDGISLDLKYLGLNDSRIPELCKRLTKIDSKVKSLELNGNMVTSKGAAVLFDTLKQHMFKISCINLSYNKIDNEGMKQIGKFIQGNQFLEVLIMSHNEITDKGIEILSDYLIDNTVLSELHLNNHESITDRSIEVLIKMIESSHLTLINLSDTRITKRNQLAVQLAQNTMIYGSDKLFLSEMTLYDDDVNKMCGLMKKYGINNLKEINLRGNKISSIGASSLFKTLRECNAALTTLDFSRNKFDDMCMNLLGEYLEGNHSLQTLEIGFNNITDTGIEILSEYLIGNTTLNVFHLGVNSDITETSIPVFLEIAKKSCVTDIDVDFLFIHEENFQELFEALAVPIEKREIPVKSNSKSATKRSVTS